MAFSNALSAENFFWRAFVPVTRLSRERMALKTRSGTCNGRPTVCTGIKMFCLPRACLLLLRVRVHTTATRACLDLFCLRPQRRGPYGGEHGQRTNAYVGMKKGFSCLTSLPWKAFDHRVFPLRFVRMLASVTVVVWQEEGGEVSSNKREQKLIKKNAKAGKKKTGRKRNRKRNRKGTHLISSQPPVVSVFPKHRVSFQHLA